MAGRTEAQQQAVERCHRLGRERLRAARSVYSLDVGPRLGLLRDAATCFVAAIAVDVDAGAEADLDGLEAADAWSRLDELVAGGALPGPPPELATARPWLASSSPLVTPAREGVASDAIASAFVAVRWLSCRVEPRTPVTARRARFLRIGGLALGALLLVGAVLAVVLAPRNIARGKTAMASSVPDGSNRHPSGLTNGSRELTCGAETKDEASSWFVIDFDKLTYFDRVVVYNRGDGNPAENLPLALEVGDSLTALETVATRTEPFTRTQPWIVHGLNREARYVRVRKTERGALSLDEIEVYR